MIDQIAEAASDASHATSPLSVATRVLRDLSTTAEEEPNSYQGNARSFFTINKGRLN